MRCFVGIPLPPRACDAVMRLRADVSACASEWANQKWVPAENLHVTLAFLGDVSEDLIPSLRDSLARVADLPGFELVPSRLEVRSNRHASLMWIAYLDPSGGCAALESAVREAVTEHEIMLEDRPFRPHATLVRSRRRLRAVDLSSCPIDLSETGVSDPSVTLYSSRLSSRGPAYTDLATWTLRGAAAPGA